MTALTPTDERLLDEAEAILRAHDDPDRHATGAALRADSGAVYAAVSLKAGTEKASVHAEPLALGQAVLAGETGFDAVAAVKLDSTDGERRVVSACGVCRELLVAFEPTLDVIVPRSSGPIKRAIRDLLPDR